MITVKYWIAAAFMLLAISVGGVTGYVFGHCAVVPLIKPAAALQPTDVSVYNGGVHMSDARTQQAIEVLATQTALMRPASAVRVQDVTIKAVSRNYVSVSWEVGDILADCISGFQFERLTPLSQVKTTDLIDEAWQQGIGPRMSNSHECSCTWARPVGKDPIWVKVNTQMFAQQTLGVILDSNDATLKGKWMVLDAFGRSRGYVIGDQPPSP